MKTTARNGQCLADIALEALGGVEGAWALAERNGLRLTAQTADEEELRTGQEVVYEAEDMVEAMVASRYEAESVHPAGGISDAELLRLANTVVKIKRTRVEDLVAVDEVVPQTTRAQVHTGVFTSAFE